MKPMTRKQHHEIPRELNYGGSTLFSIEVLASTTGYCLPYLRRLASVGRIPASKFGRRWWFDLDDVMRALRRGREPHSLIDGL